MKLTQDSNEIETLFSNILDIYEVTVTLLGNLEDVIEITEEKQTPTVGSCFEELAEAKEFEEYIKWVALLKIMDNEKLVCSNFLFVIYRYAENMNSPASRDVLTGLLSRPEASLALRAAGHGFKEAVKYYLPKLLMQPVWHFFLYFDYIKVTDFVHYLNVLLV